MKKIFTLTALFCAGVAIAQLPALQWSGSFGGAGNENGSSIAAAPDGTLYVTGNFSGTADFDSGSGVASLTAESPTAIFIQKLGAGGNLLWVKKIDNNAGTSTPQCAIDAQGNLLVTGGFQNTTDLDPGEGTANFTATSLVDSFIIKMDSQGNYMWGKNIASAGNDSEFITIIRPDEAGNIYTTGYYYGSVTMGGTSFTSSGLHDAFIQKMDATGNSIWVKSFGQLNYDGVYGLAIASDGSIYSAGICGGTVDFDPGAGTFNLTEQGLSDGFALKLDSAGEFEWVRGIGGAHVDIINDLKINGEGNPVIVGSFSSPTIALEIPGNPQPFTNNSTGPTNDAIVLEMDTAGNFLWGKSFGGPGYDTAASLTIDETGKLYITGVFNNSVDFNPSTAVNALESAGSWDVYLQRLTADGGYEYAYAIGGSGLDQARRVEYHNGSLFLTGVYKNTVNLNPGGDDVVNVTSVGGEDYFICKFSNEVLAGPQFSNEAFMLYPNPSDGNFTLQGVGIEGAQVTIYSTAGKIVSKYKPGNEAPAQTLAQGVYFVEIIANGRRDIKKLVVK